MEVKPLRKTKVNKEMAVELEESILGEKIEAFKDLLNIQGANVTDEYMVGLYNGLILGLSILTGEEPQFMAIKKEEKKDGISS